MVALAEHDRIVAVKDAVGDALETAKLRAELDAADHSDFEIYSGDDPMLLPHLAAGVVGIVSVCSHLVGARIKEIFDAWNAGQTAQARSVYAALLPLMDTIMTVTTSPIPVKAALAMIGLDVGDPRLPLVPATADENEAIKGALRSAGLL